MASQINDSLYSTSPKPLDGKYALFSGGTTTAYLSVAAANAAIAPSYRSVGLVVLVQESGQNRQYWYKNGVLDSDLVPRDYQITGGTNINVVQVGNTITISASEVTVGDSSTTESFQVTGDFNKTFSAGTVLTSWILDTPTDATVNIGTTAGGGQIFNAYPVTSTSPPLFQYSKYFKTDTIWYFTGIPSGTLVIFYYRPSVALT
jgi:hypothetical protein